MEGVASASKHPGGLAGHHDLLLLTGLLVSGGTAGTSSALSPLIAAVPKLLDNTVPSAVSDATRLGAIDPDTSLTLIAPPDPRPPGPASDQYVQEEYTQGSPLFHHFLTPSAFASFYGATTTHVNAVVATLRNLGFTVAAPAANRLYVEFTGPAALVEQTFGTVIDRLRLPAALSSVANTAAALANSVTTFTANVTNLTLPASLSDLVSGLVGLNSLDTPHDNLALPTAAARAKEATLLPTLPTLPETGLDGGLAPCVAAIAGAGYTAPHLAQA